MGLIVIAAIADDLTIGNKGKIPWYIPQDLARFRNITMGCPVIMGRKTYDSLPDNLRPLPHRKNIVISKSPSEIQKRDNLVCFDSFDAALGHTMYDSKVYVAGGAEIYSQALHLADRLEITHVHLTPGGDAKFPEIDWKEFERVYFERREGFDFASYERI